MADSIGELVRKNENDYLRGNTQISKYVSHSMHDTLEQITAYLNYKHTSGEFDALGRDKPFFNISIGAANIWYRATDLDRKNIKVRATKAKDWIDSFLATVIIQDWMRRTAYGQFLNEWGRVLSRFGSAVLKFVEKDGMLHIFVVPWLQLIVDAVDFDGNAKIEVIELTQAQLRKRIKTHGYDREQVKELCTAFTERETLDKRKKDTKSGYIKLYEVHGDLPKSYLTGEEKDEEEYVQQMHVISFVAKRNGRNTEYQDFSLYKGEEEKDPYMITHLIKEDGRTLSMGAVEHLFQSQWMANHSMKSIKDTLDIANKLILQTSDPRLFGNNLFGNFEDGQIVLHGINQPLTKVDTSKPDIASWSSFAVQWKQLGNEINGISEAMLGAAPKSGTAWRQTEALLQESYSLFEVMAENKGLDVERMFRERIIPSLKKKLDTTDEITAVLDTHDITRIDRQYIKNKALKNTNSRIAKKLFNMEPVTPEEQMSMLQEEQSGVRESLDALGGQRFFKPSELDDKTWNEQLKDLEWELDIDVTGESFDVQEALTTLNTALKLIVTPGFDQNPKAQAVVGRIFELTGTMSPLEYYALPQAQPVQQPNQTPTTVPQFGPQRSISQ